MWCFGLVLLAAIAVTVIDDDAPSITGLLAAIGFGLSGRAVHQLRSAERHAADRDLHHHVAVDVRRDEEDRVDAIENAAMAW